MKFSKQRQYKMYKSVSVILGPPVSEKIPVSANDIQNLTDHHNAVKALQEFLYSHHKISINKKLDTSKSFFIKSELCKHHDRRQLTNEGLTENRIETINLKVISATMRKNFMNTADFKSMCIV